VGAHRLEGVTLSGPPDGEAEGNLVDEVSNVVGEVARRVTPLAEEVSEEVAERVDGPSDGDDEAHGVIGRLEVLGDLGSGRPLLLHA